MTSPGVYLSEGYCPTSVPDCVVQLDQNGKCPSCRVTWKLIDSYGKQAIVAARKNEKIGLGMTKNFYAETYDDRGKFVEALDRFERLCEELHLEWEDCG